MVIYKKIIKYFHKTNQCKILFGLFLIILILITVVYLFKTKKQDSSSGGKSIYDNSGYSSVSEEIPNSFDPNYLVFSQPFPNSTPLFELSQESSDKKNIWSFVKNNFELTLSSTINEDEISSLPFVVKNNQSNYHFNISGFVIDIDEIQSGQERVSAVKKIEQQIINLGYQSVPNNFKNSVFEIVSKDNLYTADFLVKGNQVFSFFYYKDDCDGQWGGCGISIIYSNNIDKQIKSQQVIFNKLSSSINTHPTYKELINKTSYFLNMHNSIVIDKYKIFLIGYYDSDAWVFLTEEKNDGSLKIIAIYPSEDKSEYDDSILEKLPVEISCAFESVYNDYGFSKDVAKRCSKYLKPYVSSTY